MVELIGSGAFFKKVCDLRTSKPVRKGTSKGCRRKGKVALKDLGMQRKTHLEWVVWRGRLPTRARRKRDPRGQLSVRVQQRLDYADPSQVFADVVPLLRSLPRDCRQLYEAEALSVTTLKAADEPSGAGISRMEVDKCVKGYSVAARVSMPKRPIRPHPLSILRNNVP